MTTPGSLVRAGQSRLGKLRTGRPGAAQARPYKLRLIDAVTLAAVGLLVLKLGAIHPVEPTVVREFAEGLTEIIVVEEKRSFIESAVKEILYGRPDAPAVHGKRGPDGRTQPVAGGVVAAVDRPPWQPGRERNRRGARRSAARRRSGR